MHFSKIEISVCPFFSKNRTNNNNKSVLLLINEGILGTRSNGTAGAVDILFDVWFYFAKPSRSRKWPRWKDWILEILEQWKLVLGLRAFGLVFVCVFWLNFFVFCLQKNNNSATTKLKLIYCSSMPWFFYSYFHFFFFW